MNDPFLKKAETMRKIIIIIFCSVVMMGCVAQEQNNLDDFVTVTPVITKQTTLTVSALSPTFTPVPSTRTPGFTPSATSTRISTPTSDFQNIPQVIFTPASPAICPPSSASGIAIPTQFPLDDNDFESAIKNILNSGGVEQLVRRLSNENSSNFRYEDLTNDGVRELIIRNWHEYYGNLTVFGCEDERFVNLLTISSDLEQPPGINAIQDLNRNEVKELVVDITGSHCCTGMMVYEWNGNNFESLVRTWRVDYFSGKLEYSDIAELAGVAQASIADIDGNGIYELVLDGGRPSYTGGWVGIDGPWRYQKVIYMWNGENYVWFSQKYDAPSFRFEAIQDGDTETVRGDYDLALKSYQAAIFDDKLKSWTQEVWRDLSQNQDTQLLGYPDVNKMPFNQDEYDQLSAYARYRIMIIHLKQGWESDAKTVYDTLIEKYPQWNSGYPYAELAAEFWNEFQSSRDLILSCDKAIAYAIKHEEIFEPLGSHGLFDANYEPEDICPFRR
jgi:hypothetical protein